jgi:hypothetical protein
MANHYLLKILLITITLLTFGCTKASNEPVAEVEQQPRTEPQSASIDIAKDDFPDFLAYKKETAGKSPCDLVRAKNTDELDTIWKTSIEKIDIKCEVLNEIDNEPSASTVIVATLKPNRINFSGTSVLEVHNSLSVGGREDYYVLDATYASIKLKLIPAMQIMCLKLLGTTAPDANKACSVPDTHIDVDTNAEVTSYNVDDLVYIQLHSDPLNPEHTILSKSFGD